MSSDAAAGVSVGELLAADEPRRPVVMRRRLRLLSRRPPKSGPKQARSVTRSRS
jgi:hypothetical protein